VAARRNRTSDIDVSDDDTPKEETMNNLPKRLQSLAVLLASALVAMIWIVGAAAPVETLAVGYPPPVYPPPADPTPTPTATPTIVVAPVSIQIGTRTSSTLGTYLVDPNGLALYTLSADPANGSTCVGQCVASWPPLMVALGGTVTAGSGVNGTVGTIARSDSSTQVSHDGRALYFYGGAAAPGDTNGEGIVSFGGTWHVARPTALPAPAPLCLRIVGGTWNPPGNDNLAPALNDESVKIRNVCTATKSLTGWRILDYKAAHTYRFPTGFSIRPGVTVTLFSGRGSRTATHLYWSRTSGEVWGNAFPERAYLRNAAGKTVSTFTLYPH
jgi:predicted lipoprotein with Yx(FWY)xxD motif